MSFLDCVSSRVRVIGLRSRIVGVQQAVSLCPEPGDQNWEVSSGRMEARKVFLLIG